MEYKAQRYGRMLVIVDRWFPSSATYFGVWAPAGRPAPGHPSRPGPQRGHEHRCGWPSRSRAPPAMPVEPMSNGTRPPSATGNEAGNPREEWTALPTGREEAKFPTRRWPRRAAVAEVAARAEPLGRAKGQTHRRHGHTHNGASMPRRAAACRPSTGKARAESRILTRLRSWEPWNGAAVTDRSTIREPNSPPPPTPAEGSARTP
ncbi:hypothetical protein [Salinactinospora qingdaonensis]|uniref:hypothetical protein n=1 Tax=Salinactinospora qingdaonensis TaxID=702744 RepID=UPI003CD090EC